MPVIGDHLNATCELPLLPALPSRLRWIRGFAVVGGLRNASRAGEVKFSPHDILPGSGRGSYKNGENLVFKFLTLPVLLPIAIIL